VKSSTHTVAAAAPHAKYTAVDTNSSFTSVRREDAEEGRGSMLSSQSSAHSG
jgi:hypothetical protein